MDSDDRQTTSGPIHTFCKISNGHNCNGSSDPRRVWF